MFVVFITWALGNYWYFFIIFFYCISTYPLLYLSAHGLESTPILDFFLGGMHRVRGQRSHFYTNLYNIVQLLIGVA